MKKKILVIEDDSSVKISLQYLFEEEGYNVVTAKNGKIGIGIAEEENPDLIICDIMMPQMDGFKVLKELSFHNSTRFIPFIFLTAKVEALDLRKGMELGADDYLFKPYNTSDLLNAVETRLKKNERLKAKFNLDASQDIFENDKKLDMTDSLFLNSSKKPVFIKIESIKYIAAENQYSNLCITNGEQFLIRKSMRAWEEVLPKNKFVRIHRSTIINLNYLQKVEKWFNYTFKVHLRDSSENFIISKKFAVKLKSKI